MLDVTLFTDLPPFVGMPEPEIQSLLEKARQVRLAKDQMAFCQEDEAHAFFLLLDGYIRVIRTTPDGDQVIVRYISSGELFGIAQALGRDTYPADAVAAVDCVVLAWPNMIWGEVTEKHPSFASNTYKTVGSRLQDAVDTIVEMATAKVEQRVANAIVKLVAQTGKKTEEGILIDMPLTRQDVSEMTGTTLHTVSRLMSAWEEQGWVKSGRKRVVVIDGHKLAMLARGEH